MQRLYNDWFLSIVVGGQCPPYIEDLAILVGIESTRSHPIVSRFLVSLSYTPHCIRLGS
ncbi:MAG: hypothetical protein ACLFWI_07505 [Coleofasciculus sp.]|uniref:hypothetical protein n=1 Tax=Coleofasciculus sp. TaxID=3100458 RepID=UPI003A20C111